MRVGDWVDSVSWKPLVPWKLSIVVEEDTICFPLLLGVPAILLPLEFANFVDTERVFAEAVPFVVLCFVVGDVFLAVCNVLFWGSSLPVLAITHRVVPGYSRHCVAPDADVSECVSGGCTPFSGVMFWTAWNRRTCLDGVRSLKKVSQALLIVWQAMHHK